MKCQNAKCDGQINDEVTIKLKTGFAEWTLASPCKKCGLFHFLSGHAALQKDTKKGAFLIKNKFAFKECELKPKDASQ
ncbi:hypothetical protein ACFL3E_00045 [Patescibacteria group bacterium]